MVDPGDTVTNTLKKEFGEEALNSLEVSPEENKRIQESLEHLFHHGTLVIADYESPNTTQHNTTPRMSLRGLSLPHHPLVLLYFAL